MFPALFSLMAVFVGLLFSVPTLMLAMLAVCALLYGISGRAMWTLMFLTDPDRDCELRRDALSPDGVPLSVYIVFLLLWPLVLLGPILHGHLFLGRHAPSSAPVSPSLRRSPSVAKPGFTDNAFPVRS